ncbi:MAG: ABC transporter ATP-binding protein [Cytophagales bacterium]|nr:ABC transporter ATP-binding protein [Cytophagales bacterium]
MKSLSYLNKYLLKYKYRLLLGTLFVIISNIFGIFPAQVVRYAFDLVADVIHIYFLYDQYDIQSEIFLKFSRSILLYASLILVMAFLRGVFLFFMRQTIIVVSRFIEYDLKNEIYAHYQTLPMSFYKKSNTGDLLARFSEDVSRVRMYLGPAIMYGINFIVLFTLVICFMFSVNVRLTLYALIPLPILCISIYYVSNLINKYSEEIQRNLSGLTTYVQGAFSGIRVIKAFVREKDSVEKFTIESNHYRDISLKLAFVQALFFPLMLLLIGASTILTVYIGGMEVIGGNVTVGNIAEFIVYIAMLTWPVASLGWITSLIQRAAASQERINEFLKTKTDIVSVKELKKPIIGNIVFKNVSFVYPDSGIVALKNISFEIKSGETAAFVGPTGCGKSTIANLICRLYDISGGAILIDGKNIKDYSLHSLRSQIGCVPQDVFLFSDTIKNNISYGNEQAGEEDIIKAAKDAELYDNVMDFSNGFETSIGERGITLSGGQKQRVSIARALIRDPQILILDDCLSAVDTKTGHAILNNLYRTVNANNLKVKTTIIISHRVSSVKSANRIMVIKDGEIVEEGMHKSLLEKDGVYRSLYEKQLQAEEEV